MPVSVLELFSIGLGPSSSHTVGPMRAARRFVNELKLEGVLKEVGKIRVELFGSLAMTGKGHATDIAILLGLEGCLPERVNPDEVAPRVALIRSSQLLHLDQSCDVPFVEGEDLLFHKGKRLPFHSNAMKFSAWNRKGQLLESRILYSVGGGFILDQEEVEGEELMPHQGVQFPYPFKNYSELAHHCEREGLSIDQVVLANERALRPEAETRAGILRIWEVMCSCAARGCAQEGYLPGGLNVKRRAPGLFQRLTASEKAHGGLADPSEIFDWVSLIALAVNEENAAGGKVVTAPTNGAAGVIPSILHYYQKFTPHPTEEGIIRFFLTATAIGILYKEGASLSAAEMGCQGEVGVACSMAAGGLVIALGGSNEEAENAAEIAMEHNLGLTCDPVGGLVQIPCIERNTMGAVKAINAARLAMGGGGESRISLDQVIAAMRETGHNMNSIYKETSEGGLALQVAVNQPEC